MAALRPLFRPEAVQAQSQQWLGGVQLVRPLSMAWLVVGVLACLVVVVLFLTLAQYTRKASAPGVLAPDSGLIRLVPTSPGTVIERHATEGQVVAEGDLLFVLLLERTRLSGDAQALVQRSLDDRRRSLTASAQAQQSLARERKDALDRRLQALHAELAQIDAEVALQQQRRLLAEQALARLESLQSAQFVSSAQVQAKSEEVLALRAAQQALVRQRASLTREQAELEGELKVLPLVAQGHVGDLERSLAQLTREAAEQDAQQRLVVRAPRAGTVSAVLAEVGQSVTPSAALATLLPAGARLQAQLYAPSSAVGFVQPGQAVRLRFDAFAYQKYGHQPGRVLQVSRTPLAASEMAALALPAVAAGGEPLFRITVALDETPAALPLAPGMRLQADVLLDRRRLIEWLFEPLLGWQGRL